MAENEADTNAPPTQGTTYHRIIESVIENCHVTFEEEGVDQTTLDDLRTVSEAHFLGFFFSPARCWFFLFLFLRRFVDFRMNSSASPSIFFN